MAHESQERYSNLVLAKLRQESVLKVGVVFNNDYEGSPAAGLVKIPVRDTEVAVSDYDRANGIKAGIGSTSYENFVIDKDKAVNEIIDGYDAATVPDNLVADRLDSAGYSLALQEDNDGASVLIAGSTPMNVATLTKDNIYSTIVDIRTAMNKANIPINGRYLLVTPETSALILNAPEFIKASALGDTVVQTGAIGKIAGFLVPRLERQHSEPCNDRRSPEVCYKSGRIQGRSTHSGPWRFGSVHRCERSSGSYGLRS